MNYLEQVKVEEDITLSQYDLMLHAIGFERQNVKYRKFKAFRNYFYDRIDSGEQWTGIIRNGLAITGAIKNNTHIYYTLTGKGIELISRREKCKIEIN